MVLQYGAGLVIEDHGLAIGEGVGGIALRRPTSLVTARKGNLSITGYGASLTIFNALTGNQGTLAVAGKTASAVGGTGQFLAGTKGVLAVVGRAATVTTS